MSEKLFSLNPNRIKYLYIFRCLAVGSLARCAVDCGKTNSIPPKNSQIALQTTRERVLFANLEFSFSLPYNT